MSRLSRAAFRLVESKRLRVVTGVLFAAALAGLIVVNINVSRGYFASHKDAAALTVRFDRLSQSHTNQCSLASVDANGRLHGRLQGSCCSRMDFNHYVQQVVGVRAYAHITEIPADPYDIPVGLARRLAAFNDSIPLRPDDQAVYDRAIRLSDEHGPCCCHCWRWRAFEGMARYLIARREWGAEQVAAIWDLEDGCGGGGKQT